MKINKQELLNALEIVKPGLANKEIIEQTTSFAFTKGRVVTYNDRISISHPVKGLELEGAILAENLYKFLGKVKQDELELAVEGSEIIIKSGRSKAGLTMQSEVNLPLSELGEKWKWKNLPKDFDKSLLFCAPNCSKNMSEQKITGVQVNKNGQIEATDSYRAARYDLSEEIPINSFLIPATSAVEVIKMSPIRIAESKGWVHFQNELEATISCRILAEKFPEISHLIVMEGEKVILPRSIDEVLDRAMVFSKRDHMLDEEVDISIKDKRLKIYATCDTGWFEEEVNVPYVGDPISFSIAPYLLRDIILQTQECKIGKEKIKFEGSNWVYVSVLLAK